MGRIGSFVRPVAKAPTPTLCRYCSRLRLLLITSVQPRIIEGKEMDFTPIISQVWGMLSWFIPVMLLIVLIKSPWAKGYIGELLVRLFAHWQLDRQTYRSLPNISLSTPDGTTQIDHVFLSPYGIFVLETKNMSGWIFGSEKQPQWTQKLYKRTFKFQN